MPKPKVGEITYFQTPTQPLNPHPQAPKFKSRGCPAKVRALELGSGRSGVQRSPAAEDSAYQPALWLDEGPVDAVHLVVEATGIAQVVSRPIPPPQRSGHGPAVDTFSAFREVIKHIYWMREDRGGRHRGLTLCRCPATLCLNIWKPQK